MNLVFNTRIDSWQERGNHGRGKSAKVFRPAPPIFPHGRDAALRLYIGPH